MKNKLLKTTIIGIMILGLFLMGCQQNNIKTDNIKIGVIAPLSGGPALWGQGSLNMINMAVEEINKEGGINGKQIIIIPEDGKCQPQAATTAAQKLINADGVKFILGGHCSPETAAIAPILNKNKVFGLAGISTSTGILDKYDYVFRTSPTNMEQGNLIAKVALNKYKLKKVVVLSAQTAFTKSISNDFITAFKNQGGKIIATEEYAWPETTDFKTQLNKIKKLNPDGIFVSSQGVEGVQILKQIKELGMTSTLMGNTVFINKKNTDEKIKLPKSAFTVAPYVDPTTTKAVRLITKYKNKYGTSIPYNLFFVGSAYDGVYMLKDAIEECDKNTTCIKNYFNNIKDWKGTTATFNFNENGDPILNNWRELNIINGTEVFSIIS